MRVLAELVERMETETAQGGLAVGYEPLGVVWLRPFEARVRRVAETGLERRVETRDAEARVDPRLSPGLLLRWGGADWRIDAVGENEAGRVRLGLERTR